MKPVVRVTAEMPCANCEHMGRRWGHKFHKSECGVCGGTGTVARDVSCRDCRHWGDEGRFMVCTKTHRAYQRTEFQYSPSADWGCKAWEPRE